MLETDGSIVGAQSPESDVLSCLQVKIEEASFLIGGPRALQMFHSYWQSICPTETERMQSLEELVSNLLEEMLMAYSLQGSFSAEAKLICKNLCYLLYKMPEYKPAVAAAQQKSSTSALFLAQGNSAQVLAFFEQSINPQ